MKCTATVGKPNILATTSSFAREFATPRETLEGRGLKLFLNPWGRKLHPEELLELLERHQPVGLLAGTEPINREILLQAQPYLRVISRVGAGWDNVDHQTAGELGIAVFRTAGVLTQAVAELTIGMMLAALRGIPLQDRSLKGGAWQKRMGGLLQGKVVGLIGFGAIGQRVGELAQAFGSEVIYCDPQPKSAPRAKAVSLDELLERAEIISLHVSGRQTILGAAELNALGNRGVILINTARGELVDEASLYDCLMDGGIGCACLDVFCQEPYQGPLCSLDNVILTPHVGSYALEARKLMEETAVTNLLEGLQAAGVLRR
jgi:D-3-phosphoglycerate dehydrogenase